MMRARILSGLMIALLALGACAKPGERTLFDGKYYPTRAKKDGERREDFVITVKRADQGISGAREAGRWEATRYCVETYGDSTITWQPGSDPDGEAAITEGGSLIMRGSCVEW